jgi:subfamily B ATP-binding cassette protein MsbA
VANSIAALAGDLARPYRAELAVVLGAMLIETAAALAAPWPLKIVVDYAVRNHSLALVAAALQVGIALVGGAASYADNYFTESVGRWVGRDLSLRVYDHLERLSFSYYDKHDTGPLLSTITDDVATVQDFVSSSVLSILMDALTIAGMLGVMFWLDWKFASLMLLLTPSVAFFVMRFKRAVQQATREFRKRESDVMATEATGLQSMRTVQAFGAETIEIERLGIAATAAVAAALRARRIKSLLSPVFAVIVAASTAGALWRGSRLIAAGSMTIGALTVFVSYLGRFFKPVQDLAKMTNAVAQAEVAMERISAILAVDSDVAERPDARAPEGLAGTIAFEHVRFAYNADEPVLHDVTFSVAAGEFVAIVGPTGSGKSTVVSLIPRFYDPRSGRIRIDDADIREFTLRGLRRQFGFVLQETALFHGTIRDNIGYGRDGASNEDIQVAALLADADEFISRLPHGYDTEVGERGITLSGGQRQRIGIARAFVRNAPILVLDEPTSALDPEAEEIVLGGLRRLMKGRTVVMITHRLHTIRDADRIIVIHGGMVAEQGRHDDLLALGGIYADLVAHTGTSDSAPAHAHAR